jgi:hypothetical protein
LSPHFDVDFCLRLGKAGYRNVWTPYAEFIHLEYLNRGSYLLSDRNQGFVTEFQYTQERWGDVLLKDPYYSPNLTLEKHDFSLAWPPRILS